jgi:hypothetical protein
VRHLDDRAHGGHAGAVHHGVDPSETVQRLAGEALDLGRVGHVGRDAQTVAGQARGSVQVVAAPGREGEAVAAAGEFYRRGAPDPAAGAGDDRDGVVHDLRCLGTHA